MEKERFLVFFDGYPKSNGKKSATLYDTEKDKVVAEKSIKIKDVGYKKMMEIGEFFKKKRKAYLKGEK